jgi:hypothetical protein
MQSRNHFLNEYKNFRIIKKLLELNSPGHGPDRHGFYENIRAAILPTLAVLAANPTTVGSNPDRLRSLTAAMISRGESKRPCLRSESQYLSVALSVWQQPLRLLATASWWCWWAVCWCW